jgi:prophage regulatory protein
MVVRFANFAQGEYAVKPIYLDIQGVVEAVALSKSTIRRMIAQKDFPAPRQVSSGRRVAWLVRELEEWAEARPVSTILPVGAG